MSESSAFEKLQAIRRELEQRSFERQEVITGLCIGLLTGFPVLLVGPPGTDKSRLLRSLCSRIDRAKYFGRLLTKHTRPDELFGPLDPVALDRGEYRRVTTGRLPEAEVVFLDEVFKSGSSILNTLLEIMNERTFNDGTEDRRVPIRLFVGASNELPNPEDGLEALNDRFVLRYRVEYLKRDDSLGMMLQLDPDRPGRPDGATVLTPSDLESLSALLPNVLVPHGVHTHLVGLRKALHGKGITVSDRRLRQIVDVLRARALLEGRDKVELVDFAHVLPCLWSTPDQIPTIAQELQKLPKFAETRLKEIGQRVQQVEQNVRTYTTPWREGALKLGELLQEVEFLLASADDRTKRDASIISEVKTIRRAVAELRAWVRKGAPREPDPNRRWGNAALPQPPTRGLARLLSRRKPVGGGRGDQRAGSR